jgi:hypothetical protein
MLNWIYGILDELAVRTDFSARIGEADGGKRT